MTRTTLILAAGVLGVAALASSGCSSDPVGSSTAALSVRYSPSPAGAGRFGDGQGDEALLTIRTVLFRPVDPEMDELLGDSPLMMRFSTYDANLARTDADEFAAIALAPGTYRITGFDYRPPRLQDSGASQAAPVCIDRIAAIPSGPAQIDVPFIYDLNEADGLTFTVAPGQTSIDMAIDVPGLIAAYSAAFTCTDSCGGGNACLTAFDVDAGRAAFVDHISFH